MRLFCVTTALLLLLAGCTSDPKPDVCEDCKEPTPPLLVGAHSTVAVIDTGTNPYHIHFQREGGIPEARLQAIEAAHGSLERITLTQKGTYEERLEADKAVWDGMEQGVLYHFVGTSLLGISFGTQVPVLDDGGSSHGTGTTGAVLDANPDAIVILVEGDYADAEAWVAGQDWIDITSMSYGPPGSIPGSGAIFGLDTHTHTKAMWERGRLPVGAADNTPSLAPNDETAGPPWVLGVAGDHPETQCREHISGTMPDFTADFTQELPEAYTIDEYRSMSGTSFATPMTAGTLSLVLQEVRNATGGSTTGGPVLAVDLEGQDIDNHAVREAVERTAYYFGFDCSGGAPVNPAAPWTQQGWGHVGPEIVNATVAHLLGLEEAPPKPAEAQAFMDAQMRYRQTLWGVLP